MDAECLSTSQSGELPLVKTRSIEWSGESMRPEMRLTLIQFSGLVVLILVLLLLIPPYLGALVLTGQTADTSARSEMLDTANAALQNTELTQACVPRTDWVSYPIQPDDSLPEIARRTGISLSMLTNSNCLQSSDMPSGSTLYLPAAPGH